MDGLRAERDMAVDALGRALEALPRVPSGRCLYGGEPVPEGSLTCQAHADLLGLDPFANETALWWPSDEERRVA